MNWHSETEAQFFNDLNKLISLFYLSLSLPLCLLHIQCICICSTIDRAKKKSTYKLKLSSNYLLSSIRQTFTKFDQ